MKNDNFQRDLFLLGILVCSAVAAGFIQKEDVERAVLYVGGGVAALLLIIVGPLLPDWARGKVIQFFRDRAAERRYRKAVRQQQIERKQADEEKQKADQQREAEQVAAQLDLGSMQQAQARAAAFRRQDDPTAHLVGQVFMIDQISYVYAGLSKDPATARTIRVDNCLQRPFPEKDIHEAVRSAYRSGFGSTS